MGSRSTLIYCIWPDPDSLLSSLRIHFDFFSRSEDCSGSEDPEPLFPNVNPRIRIRIHVKMRLIQNAENFFLGQCPHVLRRAASILVRTLMRNNLLVLLSVCHKLLNRIFERWPTMYNCKKVNASSAFFFFCHFVCLSFGLFLSIRS